MKLTRQINLSVPDILFCQASDSAGIVYAGSSDMSLSAWDLTQDKPERQVFSGEGHTSYVTGIGLTAHELITCAYDGQLCWWDRAERQLKRRVAAHSKWARGVAISPDQTRVVSVADDMQVKLWDVGTGELIRTLDGHAAQTPHHFPSMLYAATWSPSGQHLATVDRIGQILLWEAESGQLLKTLEAPVMYTWDPRARRHSIGGIRCVSFSADGQLLAVGGMGKVGNIDHLEGKARLEVFDWQQETRVLEYESSQFKGLVERIAFAPDGDWLVAVGGDHKGFVSLLHPRTGEVLDETGHDTHIHDVTLHPTEQKLITVGHNRCTTWSLAAS